LKATSTAPTRPTGREKTARPKRNVAAMSSADDTKVGRSTDPGRSPKSIRDPLTNSICIGSRCRD
jgi:hypothetical protein